MDAFDLYERCVQSPADLIPLLVAIHGGEPRVLGEDFSGSALLSRAWAASSPQRRAIAVDWDERALARAGGVDRVACVLGDVRSAPDAKRHAVDALFVGNFSIGELGERSDLVRYLRRSRERLNAGGIFVCDTYGGSTSLRPGRLERTHRGPDGSWIRSTWEQREVDPLTGRVVDALHFRVERAGEVVLELTDAFVYRWRLWTVPELRDALREAGFGEIEIWSDLRGPDGGPPEPVRAGGELGPGFAVCLSARR